MKNPWEWDEKDLLTIVSARTQESIELEFKDSAALQDNEKAKDEISKDISAFANSAGGTLVYGIREDKATHAAAQLSVGSDPTKFSKEWLEQVINSRIHRRIDGIRIKQIELETTSPGQVAYVVWIPSSSRAPHQASDKRFYKRFNFQSIPMEEYEVRDTSLRGEIPNLRIDFGLEKTELKPIEGTTDFDPISLQVAITNEAIEPANYAVIKLFIDARLDIFSVQGASLKRNRSLSIEDKEFPVTVLQVNWGIGEKLPIFHAVFDVIDALQLRMPSDGRFGNPKCYLLGYEIKSPRMPVKISFALLEVRSGYAYLSSQHLTAEEVLANYDRLRK